MLSGRTWLHPLKGNGKGRTLRIYLSRPMARTLFGATSLRQQQCVMIFYQNAWT